MWAGLEHAVKYFRIWLFSILDANFFSCINGAAPTSIMTPKLISRVSINFAVGQLNSVSLCSLIQDSGSSDQICRCLL